MSWIRSSLFSGASLYSTLSDLRLGKQPGPGAPALLPNLPFRHRSGAGPREHSLNRPSGSLCSTSAPEQPSIALHGSARALQHTHL